MVSELCKLAFLCVKKIKHLHALRFTGHPMLSCNTRITIKNKGRLLINHGVCAMDRVSLSVIGGELTIGEKTSFNRNDTIVCRDYVSIGNNCGFGPNVVIYDHDHLFDLSGFSNSEYKTSPIII